MLLNEYSEKNPEYEKQYLEFLLQIKENAAVLIGKASLSRLSFFMSGYEFAFQELTGYRLWFNKEFQTFIEKYFSSSGTQHWSTMISIGKTDEELSLVCRTEDTPGNTTERDDGWRGFRIQGVLDFSLIGILSKLSGILAAHRIGIFAVSTYNTDYILVKEEDFERALEVLSSAGYTVL